MSSSPPRRAALAALLVVLSGLAAACGGGSGESEDFNAFAKKVADAAERGDVAFFADRVQGTPHTCTEDEVAQSMGPDAPTNPICLEAGFEFDQVYITNYGAPGNVTTVDDLVNDLQLFFQGAVAAQEDGYGPGAVRLYATARPNDSEDAHTAVLTALLEAGGVTGRAMRGIDFRLVDGRWVIPGETAASFPTAVDLLEPSTATLLYQDWSRYE